MTLKLGISRSYMHVTRTIHPIGQGAFYTERIECDNRVYNVVYDCGSNFRKNASAILKREIASYYANHDVIDILFISHFDNDHINGIDELRKRTSKIKNIVVPLIEKKDFWFYEIENEGFQSFYNSLSRYADRVYKIIPAQENDENANNYQLNDVRIIDFSEVQDGKKDISEVQNATRFLFGGHVDWCYIPFNYDQKERLEKLKCELVKLGISVAVLESGWDSIIPCLDEIKKAYKNILPDGANKTSLIVYSGGLSSEYDCTQYQGKLYILYRRYYSTSRREGCLYFGDNDLNQPNILVDLRNKLRYVVNRVATIQVPHHGALKNFNRDLFTVGEEITFFLSFGNKNTYGHPSVRVVEDILWSGNALIEVTENRDSAYIQIIKKRSASK